MAWADAKAQIVTVLGGIAITSPVTLGIQHVYEQPPATLTDLPCFVLYPPKISPEFGPGWIMKTNTLRIRLFLKDADLSQAAALAEAFGAALVSAFASHFTLAGTAEAVSGPEVEEASSFEYPLASGKRYTGFDALLTVKFKEEAAITG